MVVFQRGFGGVEVWVHEGKSGGGGNGDLGGSTFFLIPDFWWWSVLGICSS